ncbi:MAG TPA: hypothetical protein VF575_04680 [Candidatus Saccharimonadales bacterium]|jgi:hypothetical protein
MAETARTTETALAGDSEGCAPDISVNQRLLRDVLHIRERLAFNGSLSDADQNDMLVNYMTGVQEMAMPGAVTTTIQRFEAVTDEWGRSKRVLRWLGRSAVEIAEAGAEFYVSEAGRRRNDIEVREARDSEETLQAGTAKVFISPKMSRADASNEVAKSENLYEDDAVRVSYAITDKLGVVIGRQTQSLLVRDIPLEAWIALLEDPNNIFDVPLTLANKASALSVMESFRHLELPDELVPEGPVTILKSVLPYIANPSDRRKVEQQIARFRGDQQRYRVQSERTAKEWLNFDIELARSMERGRATPEIEQFIAVMQHAWNDEDVRTILGHDVAGSHIMTERLAAMLEKAKRHLLMSEAAVVTSNQSVLDQVDEATAQQLQVQIDTLYHMQSNNMDAQLIASHQAQIMRSLARQNFKISGGCAGGTQGNFRQEQGTNGLANEFEGLDSNTTDGEASSWTWKKGVCRVESCPSPRPTEVGPCSVCRNCQHKFDSGIDPTMSSRGQRQAPESQVSAEDVWKSVLDQIRKYKTTSSRTDKLNLAKV